MLSFGKRALLWVVVPLGLTSLMACGDRYDEAWFQKNTVSQRNKLKVPVNGAQLDAEELKKQLADYDPGSLLRCDAELDAAYQQAIDTIGGVSWGYNVRILEDQSKPRFQMGYEQQWRYFPSADAENSGGSGVEIAEADIVGLSDTTALFLSRQHGVFLVDLSGATPTFTCATKLPGRVGQFYYHKGHLIVMTAGLTSTRNSYLLHFSVTGNKISFVESVDLGAVSILDSRRFNDRLVIFTDLSLEPPADSTDSSGASSGEADAPSNYYAYGQAKHRELRVFRIEDKLNEELRETLLDTTQGEDYLMYNQPDPSTPIGTVVHESNSFGTSMWASDHYFVVTKQIDQTLLGGWQTRTYNVCTASHTVEVPYTYCWTEYEQRPNPNYKPADNSGGDRACNGMTLSDCLQKVSQEASKYIQVPVGKKCEQRVRQDWFCDAYEQRSETYPTYNYNTRTQLYIYEYFDSGFIKLDDKVSEITTEGLDQLSSDDSVATLTTSDQEFDLRIPGAIQTLQFQNGFLYVISQGNLQVYAMAENSLVRTSSLPLVNDTLQTALFTEDKLFLSDFRYTSYNYQDRSTLKVVDLSNGAFPRLVSQSHELPGGHSSILPTDLGILTIGTVQNYAPNIQSVLKLGLFTDPYASEIAYLILGTDLMQNSLGDVKSHYYNAATRRLFLPYSGNAEEWWSRRYRIGVSHLEPDTIVSEGAVDLPELASRVRPLPGAESESMLAFADSSIEWLVDKGAPAGDRWEARPVLEYYTPIALYRLTDEDLWLEVLRLGNRCKLRFAARAQINARAETLTTEPFDCDGSYPWAYENNIIFSSASGVRFTQEGQITQLDQDEIAALEALREQRQICLFSQQIVDDPEVDFDNPPSLSGLRCMTPEVYQANCDLLSEGQGGDYPEYPVAD